ncbi:hypothetical protein [Streptomyces sp. NPDC087298]|uniref:hypothetical protein n=1 Tax=Streptomyces sp. NPDC087298 TaxID=3365779 RepID=UPI0038050DF8
MTARPPSLGPSPGGFSAPLGCLCRDRTAPAQDSPVRAHYPVLDALIRPVRAFATTLTEHQGERLPDWLDAVRQDSPPSLHAFAAGIRRDFDAATAGLTLPWNSGVVEGHVNRIQLLERQMLDHISFGLLRKRALLP